VDLNAVRLTANRSLWRRRHRAIAGFLAGYLAPWIPPGLAVARLRQPTWTHTPLAAALCLAGAALWQRTPCTVVLWPPAIGPNPSPPLAGARIAIALGLAESSVPRASGVAGH